MSIDMELVNVLGHNPTASGGGGAVASAFDEINAKIQLSESPMPTIDRRQSIDRMWIRLTDQCTVTMRMTLLFQDSFNLQTWPALISMQDIINIGYTLKGSVMNSGHCEEIDQWHMPAALVWMIHHYHGPTYDIRNRTLLIILTHILSQHHYNYPQCRDIILEADLMLFHLTNTCEHCRALFDDLRYFIDSITALHMTQQHLAETSKRLNQMIMMADVQML